AFPARDFAPGEHDRQAGEGHREHHPEVEVTCCVGNGNAAGRNQAGYADDCADVEDVAADDVADGDVAFAAYGGDGGGGDFRHRGADGDHGEADDEVAYAECAREGGGRIHQPACTVDKAHQAGDDQCRLYRPVAVPLGFGRYFVFELVRQFARCTA